MRRLVLLALVAIALAACSGPQVCTAIGVVAGVRFDLSEILQGLRGPIQVRACVEGTCVERAIVAPNLPQLAVAGPSAARAGWVSVSLRMIDRSHRVVLDASTRVRLRRVQPNGPGCPPVAYEASVIATKGALRPG